MPIRTALTRLLRRHRAATRPAGSPLRARLLSFGLLGAGMLSAGPCGLLGEAHAQAGPAGPNGMLPPGATVPANYQPNYAGGMTAPPQAGPMGAPAIGAPAMNAPAMGSPYGPGKPAVTPVGYVAPAGPPVAGPQAHGPAGLYPPTTNPNVHPWPQITPYEPLGAAQTTHVNRRGLWFKDTAMKGRRYNATVEGVWFKFARPDGDVIGSKIPPLEGNQIWLESSPRFESSPDQIFGGDDDNDFELAGSNLDDVLDQFPANVLFYVDEPLVFPYPFIADDADPVTGEDLVTTVLNSPLYPVRTTNAISSDEHSTGGVRLTWGFDDADGTGFEISAYYAAPTDEQFIRGVQRDGFPLLDPLQGIGPEVAGLIDPTIFALPLNTGVSTFPFFPDRNFVGFTQKFDLYTRLDYRTESHGANFSVMNKVISKRANSLIRLGFGGDYIHIGDEFGFYGIDSGTFYEADAPEVDRGVVSAADGGGGGAGSNAFTFAPGDVDFATPVATLTGAPDELFDSELNSRTNSWLGGPTVAVRYEAGGDTFKVIGESAFSLLINHERTSIDGYRIGEQTAMKTLYGIDFLNNDDGSARDTSFTDEDSHTHLSPMFKQQVRAELDVSEMIPPLQKFAFTSHTKLSGAYQLNYINRVQRASAAVNWAGFPLFPSVRAQYDDFFMHEFRLGLTMDY